jgi:hypothetical protein
MQRILTDIRKATISIRNGRVSQQRPDEHVLQASP